MSLIVSIVKFPFQLVGRALGGLGKAGTSVGNTIGLGLRSLAGLPGVLLRSTSNLFARMGRSASNRWAGLWGAAVSAVSASFVGTAYRATIQWMASVGQSSRLLSSSVTESFGALVAGLSSSYAAVGDQSAIFLNEMGKQWASMGVVASYVAAGFGYMGTKISSATVQLSNQSEKLMGHFWNISVIMGTRTLEQINRIGSTVAQHDAARAGSSLAQSVVSGVNAIVSWCTELVQKIVGRNNDRTNL